MIGQRIGTYEVLSKLGAGGMGEVYRARDTKLGRDVALKVLPYESAQHAGLVARLRREAHVLAALHHPHIATIFGFEDGEGRHALVMELVPGATLAERLAAAHGPLETKDALRIARQIALGLEFAHERGIIHRDLKPANVKVTDEGVVKVLDFGLAKETAPQDANSDDSPTVSVDGLTAKGILLGTAAYMSPEQARAKPVDKRADIWAFGVVLYEMLTGRRLFRGESSTDVITHVLTSEPDWGALPNDTPVSIRALLKRCLTRDPNNRLRDIGDARIAIDECLADPNPVTVTAAAPVAVPRRSTNGWLLAAAGILGIAGGAFGVLSLAPAASAGPTAVTTRTSIALPESQILAPPGTTMMVLSADGRRLIYKARSDGRAKLFIRDMHVAGDARAIPQTEGADSFALSPDGESVVFGASPSRGVMRLSLSGGAPVKICGCAAQAGMYWSTDGYIYFPGYEEKRWGLRRVLASGGDSTPVQVPADYTAKQLTHPAPLPGGRLLVVISDPATGAVHSPTLAVYDIAAATVTPLNLHGTAPWYVPATGQLLFGRESVLYAVSFDADALKVTGEPAPLVEHLTMYEHHGHADYAVANDAGTIVYSVMPFTRGRVVKFKPGAAPEQVLDPQGLRDLDISSDGRHLAVTVDPRGIAVTDAGVPPKSDLFTRDLTLGDFTRRASGTTSGVAFLPGSARVAFGARSGREAAINLSDNNVETILALNDQTHIPPYLPRPGSFSHDGSRLAYDYNGNLYVMALDGTQQPQDFQRSRFEQLNPAFSPDSKWIAYDLSDGRGGRPEVWVRPYPGPDPAFRVSIDGGRLPRWSADGKRLYFLSVNTRDPLRRDLQRIMGADVLPGTPFRTSRPQPIASDLEGVSAFVITRDGTFYAIVNELPGPPPPRGITVVTTWFDELRKVRAGR